MKGIIKDKNPNRGMVAVWTDEGYSVFELLSDDIFEIGDEVSWLDDTSLGDTEMKNITKDEDCEVYFQNHHVSPSILNQQLLR